MKKYIFSLAFIFSGCLTFAQLTFQIGSVNGNKNDTVLVPVTVGTGFTNIFGAQFSMSYDTNVLAILVPDSLTIVRTANFSVFYGTHTGGSANIKNGQISFSWDAPGGLPQTLQDGSLLFSIRFKLIGKECDSSFVRITDQPTKALFLNGNLEEFPLTGNVGKVKINGPGCVTQPPQKDSLEIIASTETTGQGSVKCIKVTAKGFKNISTGQFTMHWNKTVAKFQSLTSGAFNLVFGQGYSPLPDSSGVGILWFADANPVTLADNTILFEVCLTAVGSSGSSTNITFDGNPIPVEFTDGNDNIVNAKMTAGKLTITGATINLYYRDTTVEEGPGKVFCIPIRADNFKCVESFQFGMVFDTSKLKFKNLEYHLPTLGPAHFNIVKDSIRVIWAETPPANLNNGEPIFSICFESRLTNPCPFDTRLRFTDLDSGPIEFSECNTGSEFSVSFVTPDFTVRCMSSAAPVVITQGTDFAVKCHDDCNGRITGTRVTGGVGPFNYEWKLQPFNIVVSTSLDATDLCPGVYKLCVIDLGNANSTTVATFTDTIKNPDTIGMTFIITHVQVISDGKIDMTVTGGTPPYTFKWRRLSSGGTFSTTEDIMNLSANSYEIMVTDINGCIKMDTAIVNPAPLKFLDTTLTHNKCHGECRGSILLNVVGGKTPYIYKWSDGRMKNPLDSLCAGTYSVTVTDANGTTIVSTNTITAPDQIQITLDSTRKTSGASATDGAIFITVKGGTPFQKVGPKYTYQWRQVPAGPVIGASEDLTNIGVGTYSVCVTDSFNCSQCDTFVVTSTSTNPPVITVRLDIDPYLGQNAVSCRGKCDGRIIVTVTSSDPKEPYKYSWSHDPLLGTKVATGLCPGQSIVVTVTDAAGNSKVSTPLVVQDAPTIALSTRKINCASTSSATDGQYEAITTGAVLPLSYRWCNGSISKIANDLQAGDCSIQITDANGCTASETFRVCEESVGGIECYTGRLAISPNGDGYNEVFSIECATDFENVLNIYDRWGNVIYSKINYTNDWNGIDKDGEELNEGTYLWILRVKEPGKEDAYYKGTVTIVR